jgi:hypothetical protein
VGLSGCAAIQLNRLVPPPPGLINSCKNEKVEAYLSDRAAGQGRKHSFVFLLPRSASGGSLELAQAHSFDEFVRRSAEIKRYLPEEIRDDDVTNAFRKMMTKASAQAQVAVGLSTGLLRADEANVHLAAITKYSVPNKLSHRQLKRFADRLFDYQMQAKLMAPDATRAPVGSQINAFAIYFSAYYQGKFVDRFGQSLVKPDISKTVPDTEIAAAETVLLEFLFDLFDPTPVLGDAKSAGDVVDTTNFYPGGTPSNKPTAFIAMLTNYQQIKTGGCGVTVKNVSILANLANGAGDRAAAIGGLVANTPGGLSIGLGVVGKISIGDNQTLSTIVKTAASRLAARITFASSYWALEQLPEPLPAKGGEPTPDPAGPNGYLVFKK